MFDERAKVVEGGIALLRRQPEYACAHNKQPR
jgi:hypothetical protein